MALRSLEINKLPRDGEVYFQGGFMTNGWFYYDELMRLVPWRRDNLQFKDGSMIPLPRLTAYYGELFGEYTYSGIRNIPMPWIQMSYLMDIKSVVERLFPRAGTFTNCLLNYYRNGKDSIGSHSDDEKELGENPIIASVSLGATRRFVMQHKKTKEYVQLMLPHNSLLIMAGETQKYWKHFIPKEKDVREARLNLTFRKIIPELR